MFLVAEEVEVSLAVVNPSVFESDREVTAVVSLSQAFSQDIQFTIETTDGTATGKKGTTNEQYASPSFSLIQLVLIILAMVER